MKTKRKTTVKRYWLEPNNPDTHSSLTYVYNERYDEGAMTLRIADCSRSINLYFGSDKAGQRKMKRFLKLINEAADLYLEDEDDS